MKLKLEEYCFWYKANHMITYENCPKCETPRNKQCQYYITNKEIERMDKKIKEQTQKYKNGN